MLNRVQKCYVEDSCDSGSLEDLRAVGTEYLMSRYTSKHPYLTFSTRYLCESLVAEMLKLKYFSSYLSFEF